VKEVRKQIEDTEARLACHAAISTEQTRTSTLYPDRGGRACEGEVAEAEYKAARRARDTDRGERARLRPSSVTPEKRAALAQIKEAEENFFLTQKKAEDARIENVMDRERIAMSFWSSRRTPPLPIPRVSLTLVGGVCPGLLLSSIRARARHGSSEFILPGSWKTDGDSRPGRGAPAKTCSNDKADSSNFSFGTGAMTTIPAYQECTNGYPGCRRDQDRASLSLSNRAALGHFCHARSKADSAPAGSTNGVVATFTSISSGEGVHFVVDPWLGTRATSGRSVLVNSPVAISQISQIPFRSESVATRRSGVWAPEMRTASPRTNDSWSAANASREVRLYPDRLPALE